MLKRKIVKIDQDKCNGCGLCLNNCQEQAIKIINGKAILVADSLCDGLGACLGHCPQGAITIEERPAQAFQAHPVPKTPCGCPGAKVIDSGPRQWPIQLALVPANAPYLKNADLLIAADCVAFSYADFHRELLKGKVLLVACPKLDDLQSYQEKLIDIIKDNDLRSITYAHMEVPCCSGLVYLIKEALADSGKALRLQEIVISIKGERIR